MTNNPFKSNFGTTGPKDKRRWPALTEQEKAAILATRKVTKCPPARVATTFTQQLGRRL